MSAAATFRLEELTFADAVTIGQAVRAFGGEARSAADAAQAVVDYFYDGLRAGDGERACVLVRCFVTSPFGMLPEAVKQSVGNAAEVKAETRCLTLLATRGVKGAWNAPETSEGHRVIPLPDVAMIARAPMIGRLLSEFGMEAEEVVLPATGLMLDAPRRSFNVFSH